MKKQNNISTSRLILIIFFIALASLFFGVFIGLLIAPKTGRRFREMLKNWLTEMVDRGKFTFEEAKVYGNEFIEKSKERVESLSSKIFGE